MVLIVGFAVISIVNYQVTKASVLRTIIKQDLPLTMNNIYSDLSAELTRPLLVASSMATDTFLKDWVIDGEKNEDRIRKYLFDIKEKYGFFSTFFVSAHSLKYYHFKGVNKVISPTDSHDVWYYRFINLKQNYDFEVDVNEASQGILTIFINYRVEDKTGKLLGVTGVGLKVDSVSDSIKEYKQRYSRNVFLTNREGVIQVHQNGALIQHMTVFQLTGLRQSQLNHLLKLKEPFNFEYRSNGDKILANARYIKQLDWLLFVEQSESASLKEARLNLWRTIIIGSIVFVIVIAIMLLILNRYKKVLEEIAVSDELTGCANRRKLEEEYTRFVYRNERLNLPFSFILLDLDHFKKVNDTLGHLHGDHVLKTIAQSLADIVRPTDILVRWGGDEFSILTDCNEEDACLMAERIRKIVSHIHWPKIRDNGNDPRNDVTASLGVATYRPAETLAALQDRADKALYIGKKQGGNQVNLAT